MISKLKLWRRWFWCLWTQLGNELALLKTLDKMAHPNSKLSPAFKQIVFSWRITVSLAKALILYCVLIFAVLLTSGQWARSAVMTGRALISSVKFSLVSHSYLPRVSPELPGSVPIESTPFPPRFSPSMALPGRTFFTRLFRFMLVSPLFILLKAVEGKAYPVIMTSHHVHRWGFCSHFFFFSFFLLFIIITMIPLRDWDNPQI